jgi:glycosyltransferase involved in cell wall biosynthesis
MRVAVVHDYLYTLGGAEKVLKAMLKVLPGADLFCLFDVLDEADRATLGHGPTTTSFLQRMPGIRKRHRMYLPLMPLAVEQFDLSAYDVIVSSSYAVAKGVITGPDQLHIAYVHSPMRYAWDLQHQYLREAGLTAGLKGWMARLLLHRLRVWDSRTANGVNTYIANSHFVARRIAKVYGRDAAVIHPPVGVPDRALPAAKSDYFFTASRLVAYKNVHAIVSAFRALPGQKLIVAGSGPELDRLRALAGSNVEFRGYVPDEELRSLMRGARAFVFAAEEDFGIVPLEAQSEGTPVIALGRGGVRETVITEGRAPTGLFFERPEPALIAEAVRQFLRDPQRFTPAACHENALRFSEANFQRRFAGFVEEQLRTFRGSLNAGTATAELRPQFAA